MLGSRTNSSPVQSKVAAELDWDPKLDSRDITVTADRGTVALRGTVGSLRQARAAKQAARRVHGVTSVRNHLTVRPSIPGHARDSNLRMTVQHALILSSDIPATVTATVQNGIVRLAGTATWHWQRDEAESACAAVDGVLAVTNDIDLIPEPADTDIQQAIMAAFQRNASLAVHALSVDVPCSGVVTLSGTVTSCAEHDNAVTAGWSARGVARVDDRIVIMY